MAGSDGKDDAGIRPEEGEGPRSGKYFVRDVATWFRKSTAHGVNPVRLANFEARITQEIYLDDGSGRLLLLFEIGGRTQQDERLKTIRVFASDFESLRWVTRHWGAVASMDAGGGLRDHLRAAIQELSGKPPRRHVYSHLGWTPHAGEEVFLHAGGALGVGGVIPGVEVEVEGRLNDYRLPAPLEGETLREAWAVGRSLLEAAPSQVTVPLFLAPFRAVLGDCRINLHVVGTPQGGKSELAALSSGFFGQGLSARNFLCSWEDTESSIERFLFEAKDVVGMVDDFRPDGARQDVERMHAKADRVFRGAFNGHGRSRLRADTSRRPDYYPRGVVLSTGEDLPRGLSLQSRVLILRLPLGHTRWPVVDRLQKARSMGQLSGLLSAFIVWAASRREGLQRQMVEGAKTYRERTKCPSGRTLDIAADLRSAWLAVREFILSMGLEDEALADHLERLIDAGLDAVLQAQEDHLGASDPAEQFRDLLLSALNSGKAFLRRRGDEEAPAAVREWVQDDGGVVRGEPIGYLDAGKKELLLDGNTALAVTKTLAARGDGGFAISGQALWKRCVEKGWVVLGERGRNMTKRSIPGLGRQSFLVFRLESLVPTEETTETNGTE